MEQKRNDSYPVVDIAVAKLIADFRSYAGAHPESYDAALALDGVLNNLVQEAVADKSVEGAAELAIRRLEEVATLFPKSPVPLLLLSKICIDKKDHVAALRYVEAGLAVEPDYPDLLFNRALSLQETGSPEDAIEGFRRYLELNPDNPWAYNNIGDAYRTLKLYDVAENYLKLAIQHDHHFGPAYYNLALLHMDQQDWPGTVYYGQIAERHDPFNKEVQLALGGGYMGVGEPKLALQHLVAATLIDRSFAEAYESMTAAYVELDMYDLAIAAANEALELKPHSWKAMANIGYCYAEQGRYADAIQAERAALQDNPDKEGAYKLYWDLGWNLLQTDEYAQALDCTEQALGMKEYPDVELTFNKGLTLLALGHGREADAAYEQAVRRAKSQDNHQAIRKAVREAREFISRKRIEPEKSSYLSNLLGGKWA